MNAPRFFAPVALVVAAGALVVVVLQRGALGDLEARVAAQDKQLTALAAARSEGPVAPRPAEVAEVAAVDLSGVEARLTAVEREARSAGILARTLADRPEAAGAAPARDDDDDRADVSGLVGLADEVAALRTDVDALLTGRGLETPEAKQAVRTAMAEARQQSRAERMARREAQRSAWLDTFATEQGLGERVTERLREAMDADQRARSSVREAVQSGEKTWEEAREEMRQARASYNEALDTLLTEEQRAAFDAGLPGQRGGAGGQGRRGGWGGGGRPGRGDAGGR